MVNKEKLKKALIFFLMGLGVLVLNFFTQKYEGVNLGLAVGMAILFILGSFVWFIIGISQESSIIKENNKIKCTNCGAEVLDSDKYCPECGTKFKEVGIECPKCKTHNKETVKYCTKCGHKLIKGPEPELVCEYCDKKFKFEEAISKHSLSCETKKGRDKEETKTAILTIIWTLSVSIFIGFGVFFLINNKLNLIPLFLISFILTPYFDKFFNHYKKRINKLKYFEINWWKKSIAIIVIILIFILINWITPECPASCNDNNSCTNDFCSKETGYKCMNTLKLNCKGNGICESGEYGTNDCPNCDDGNKCTADSYDTGAKKCINIEMKGCIK